MRRGSPRKGKSRIPSHTPWKASRHFTYCSLNDLRLLNKHPTSSLPFLRGGVHLSAEAFWLVHAISSISNTVAATMALPT